MKATKTPAPLLWLAGIEIALGLFASCTSHVGDEHVGQCRQAAGEECLPPEDAGPGADADGSKPGYDATGPSCIDHATQQGWLSSVCDPGGGPCAGKGVVTWDCPGGCCQGTGGGGAGGGTGGTGGGGTGGVTTTSNGGTGGLGGTGGAGGVTTTSTTLVGGMGGAGGVTTTSTTLLGGMGGAGGMTTTSSTGGAPGDAGVPDMDAGPADGAVADAN